MRQHPHHGCVIGLSCSWGPGKEGQACSADGHYLIFFYGKSYGFIFSERPLRRPIPASLFTGTAQCWIYEPRAGESEVLSGLRSFSGYVAKQSLLSILLSRLGTGANPVRWLSISVLTVQRASSLVLNA